MEPKQLDSLLHPQFDAAALKAAEVVGKGLAASPGAACGQCRLHRRGRKGLGRATAKRSFSSVLRPAPRTSRAWHAAQGILTVRGGMTSHAAVVARGMGTCCVSGCGEIIMQRGREVLLPSPARTYHEGDWISIDGSTGNIYGEPIQTVEATITGDFRPLHEVGRQLSAS